MDEEDIKKVHYLHEGFSGQLVPALSSGSGSIIDICRAWYDQAMQELSYADFMSKPNLATIQTLAILALIHKNLGEQDREYCVLGLSINMARTLGMDRLGCEDSFSPELSSRLEWSDRANRELGRRLWWTLVISDW